MVNLKSNSFFLVGDLHINFSNVVSRRDSYGETVLRKLRWVFEHSLGKGCNVVLVSGDWFHTKKQTVSYLNKVVSLFAEFKKRGLYVYGILGNHDYTSEIAVSVENHPIYMLFKSEMAFHLDVLNLLDEKENVLISIQGKDYLDLNFSKSCLKDVLSCLVFHRYYEEDEHEPFPLTKEVVLKEGWDICFGGHAHQRYADVLFPNLQSFSGKSLIVRPGSLLRGTSHSEEVRKEVGVVFFDVSDPKNPKHEFVVVPHEKAEDVFISQVFDKENKQKNIKDRIKDKVEILVGMMENTSSSEKLDLNVYEKMPEEVKIHLREKLREKGIFG